MTSPAAQFEIGVCPGIRAVDTHAPVASVMAATAAADGSAVLLDVAIDGEDGRARYALPLDTVQSVIESLTKAATDARRTQTGEPEALNVHNVAWWTVRTVPGTSIIVISFRTPSGAEFSFQMHRDAADHMCETFAVAFGGGVVPMSNKRH